MLDKIKEFKPSSWAIDNKTSIYIMTIIITLAGILTYIGLPKEQFPEVVFPQIMVNTLYPGTSPKDIENLVTKNIEKQVKSISGVKQVTSNSVQDFSTVNIEFNTDVNVPVAKQRVKDAVDKARTDLPNDLPREPEVIDIDVSQMPIMYVHLSGDYPLDKLKIFADELKDKIEDLNEITRCDIVGALDREIQIDVDMYKMQIAEITMNDITNSVRYENMTISGGQIKMDGLKRSINVVGQYVDARKIENIIIRSGSGATVYLKDIATITDGFKEKESYSRLDHEHVVSLNVIKKGGQNLIVASKKIKEIANDMKENHFPSGLKLNITGDQSIKTKVILDDLINTIVIGFILVTLILMFFMGTTNAIFVAMSVPLSMFIAFMLMPVLGFTLNMIVLFSFLLALGIVVDDAIVVIENTHRIYDNGKVPIVKAAKMAAGEVFLPVLSGTLTTLAPFFPLAFWQGVIGKFMFFLPITLIVTLTASLIVAYIINPVFAVDFMKPHNEGEDKPRVNKSYIIISIVFGVVALLSYLFKNWGLGNFALTLYGLYCLNRFVLHGIIKNFQEVVWPGFQQKYKNLLIWLLQKNRPVWVLVATLGLFIFSIFLTSVRSPKIVFFPISDPNFVYTYIALPIGTDQVYTDSITQIIEGRIFKVIGDSNPIIESVIANVTKGASNPTSFDFTPSPHLSKVTVAFIPFSERNGKSTVEYLDKIRKVVKGIPGTEVTVEQEQGGPPTGKPINIEITGDEFEQLSEASKSLKRYLDSIGIPGIEELKTDLQTNKPEIIVEIDRERANREGISTGTIGSELRSAIFGTEVSKFKDANDDYPIQLRYKFDQRNNINALMNLKITYRDMNMNGQIRQIPLASVAKITYGSTYGGIKRKNQKRMVTVSSNVLSGFNANEIVAKIQKAVKQYPLPTGIQVNMTGEQEKQKETSAFLSKALLISFGLIFLILVTQFNSITKPIIIFTEIFFSIIGVLLGLSIFNMSISIVMTGVGVIALAGIVVRNGILLVEFTDLLLERGMDLKEAIIEAGKTRMTPVILTASATILGLVPLAIGLNINFISLFSDLNPHIHFGGDSAAFWGPLSWTMIFGLSFATFLTLILVPVMLLLSDNLKKRIGLPTTKRKEQAL